MFVVLNKEKIGSYFLLLSTIVILFSIAFNISNKNIVETSSNVDNCLNNVDIDVTKNVNIIELIVNNIDI